MTGKSWRLGEETKNASLSNGQATKAASHSRPLPLGDYFSSPSFVCF